MPRLPCPTEPICGPTTSYLTFKDTRSEGSSYQLLHQLNTPKHLLIESEADYATIALTRRAQEGWTFLDPNEISQGEEETEAEYHYTTGQIPSLSGKTKSSRRSAMNSQESIVDADANKHGDQRHKGQISDRLDNVNAERESHSKKYPHQHRNASRASDAENKHMVYSSDEGSGSDYSSRTTSDDYELDRLTTEDGFSDDAESGMTNKDKRHRKRRRRKAARMDEIFAGNINAPQSNKKNIHRKIYMAWLINALLVASWYAFSLSISIVSEESVLSEHPASTDSFPV